MILLRTSLQKVGRLWSLFETGSIIRWTSIRSVKNANDFRLFRLDRIYCRAAHKHSSALRLQTQQTPGITSTKWHEFTYRVGKLFSAML